MSRKANLSLCVALVLGLAGAPSLARAQDGPPEPGGIVGMMSRIVGEVTAVAPGRITIKTEAPDPMPVVTVITTDNTRLMKGRGETLKFADLKVGDVVTAAGNLDGANHALHAAMVFVVDAEQVKQLRENLGKTYIAGRVTAIDLDNATMTVMRADKVSQTIGFDETTSFQRGRVALNGLSGIGGGFGGPPGGGYGGGGGYAGSGNGNRRPPNGGGESITLADIKVGDAVAGQGSLKNGVFVPTRLNVASPVNGQGRRRNGEGTPANTPPPATTTPPQR
jgi:hypothetical protein